MKKRIWFKKKQYGWGWYPATWQGWVVTAVYIGLIIFFSLSIDEDSPVNEIMFTFILPLILLTLGFIRIAYKMGEKPEWRWGKKKSS